MKQPPTFNTGEPSYFVAASTPGSCRPTVLTMSNGAADRRRGVIADKYRHVAGSHPDWKPEPANREPPTPRPPEPATRRTREPAIREPQDERYAQPMPRVRVLVAGA